jgi:hypothetical protein
VFGALPDLSQSGTGLLTFALGFADPMPPLQLSCHSFVLFFFSLDQPTPSAPARLESVEQLRVEVVLEIRGDQPSVKRVCYVPAVPARRKRWIVGISVPLTAGTPRHFDPITPADTVLPRLVSELNGEN